MPLASSGLKRYSEKRHVVGFQSSGHEVLMHEVVQLNACLLALGV